MDISLIMHDPYLKLYKCIKDIAVEGKVSQIFDIGPGLFSIKSSSLRTNVSDTH